MSVTTVTAGFVDRLAAALGVRDPGAFLIPLPERHYLYFPQSKLLYCPIPKVACTSLKQWLSHVCCDNQLPRDADVHKLLRRTTSLGAYRMRATEIPDRADVFEFAFVRNPWDRLVSAWLSKFVNLHRLTRPVVEAYAGCSLTSWERHQNATRNMTFVDFVEQLEQCDIDHVEEHWRSQSTFLKSMNLRHLGRFENLHADVEPVREFLGVDLRIPDARNKTSRIEGDSDQSQSWESLTCDQLRQCHAFPAYDAFYSESLAERVGNLYRDDVIGFGYSFTPCST